MFHFRRVFFFAVFAILDVTLAAAQNPEQDWLLVLQGEITEMTSSTISMRPEYYVVAFSDRPNHFVRLTSVTSLASIWDEAGFSDNPPNAALINQTKGEISVLEIAEFSGNEATVSMKFKLLEGYLPTAGDRIGLTIDGVPDKSVEGKLLPR